MLKLKALAILVSVAPSPLFASSTDLVDTEGFRFAKVHCAECHRISPGDVTIGFFEAPAFQTIANDPATTELSLRVFLRTPHSRMPDFILTEDQTQDVIDYILSLK